jgi:hypothetical protein
MAMANNYNQELLNIESELNCLKREREVLGNNFEARRRNLLDQMRRSQSSQTNVQLINEIGQLNNEMKRAMDAMDVKIFNVRQAYFKKLRE